MTPRYTVLRTRSAWRQCCGPLAIVLATLVVLGCDGTTLTHFNTDEDIPETRVQGQGAISLLPAVFPPTSMDVTQTDAYEQEDFDLVTSIRVTSLQLTISDSSDDEQQDSSEDGQPDNFDFLQSVDIMISADINGAEREERVAFLAGDDAQVGSGTRQLELITTGIDVLPFIEAEGGYSMQTRATGAAPPDDLVFGGAVRYRVGVGFN